MSKLTVVKNQLPATDYTLASAVKDFRLLEQAEKGRDFVLNLIKTDLQEFIAQANDLLLVDQESGKWLLNFVINHVVRRDGKYNSLLPVNMTISANKDKGLSFKTKSESELAKDDVLAQTSKLLQSIVDNDIRKKLADMPTSSLSKTQDRLTAVQTAIVKQKEDSIARIALNNAKLEITKALKLVPEGEFKTTAESRVLNTVEDCKNLGDEINAFLKDGKKDVVAQAPTETKLEQPRDKPQGVAKLSPSAGISDEAKKEVQTVVKIVTGKLNVVQIRELILELQEFISDELDQTGTN